MSEVAVTQSQSPELPREGSKEFSEAHYRFLSKLIGSQFAMAIYEEIKVSDLSLRCKRGAFTVISQLFDQNAMLAHHAGTTPNDIINRYLQCDLVLLLWDFECVESDIQNPSFMNIKENIRIAYRDFINRPEERVALFKSGSTVKYEGLNPPAQPQQPDRFNPLRR